MTLQVLAPIFSICKIPSPEEIDWSADFLFVGKTDEELSVVAPAEQMPAGAVEQSQGWRAFRIKGELDFSLIGILAGISDLLAKNKIGIFVVSTFQTDYVLTKCEQMDHALAILRGAGYCIETIE